MDVEKAFIEEPVKYWRKDHEEIIVGSSSYFGVVENRSFLFPGHGEKSSELRIIRDVLMFRDSVSKSSENR